MSGSPAVEGGHDALAALCDEMSSVIASGGESATLSELLLDPGAAICDDQGRVLACTSIRHLGAFSAVAAAYAAGWSFPVEAESVVLLNDPFGGGTRVLDFYAVHPVEVAGAQARWITVSRSSGADLGGNCFGGYNPAATEVWAEGARITPLRVYEAGSWARETLACVTLNSRTPHLLASQLRTMITAVVTAGRKLAALVVELGPEAEPVAEACLESAAVAVGGSLPDAIGGSPFTQVVRSSDGEEQGHVTVAVRRANGTLVLDLSESAPAAGGYTNATRPTTVSAALGALFAGGEGGPVASDALLRSVELITRPGSIVDAGYPAPTVCGELTVAAAVREAVSAAVTGGETRQPGLYRGILDAKGRLSEALAESLRADEAQAASRMNGGPPWP